MEAKKYFSTILAALIVLAVAVAAFVYSAVKTTPEDMVDLDPVDVEVPDYPPFVPAPTAPPPSN